MSNRRQASTRRFIGYIMAMSASILFGFNGNLSRLLFNDGISPVTLVEFRMLIGGASLLIVLVGWKRRELKLPRRSIPWIIVFGLSLALVIYIAYLLIGRRVGRDLPPTTSTAYGAIVAGIFWLIGPALKKEPRSRKVDKCGTVFV